MAGAQVDFGQLQAQQGLIAHQIGIRKQHLACCLRLIGQQCSAGTRQGLGHAAIQGVAGRHGMAQHRGEAIGGNPQCVGRLGGVGGCRQCGALAVSSRQGSPPGTGRASHGAEDLAGDAGIGIQGVRWRVAILSLGLQQGHHRVAGKRLDTGPAQALIDEVHATQAQPGMVIGNL